MNIKLTSLIDEFVENADIGGQTTAMNSGQQHRTESLCRSVSPGLPESTEYYFAHP